MTRRFCMSQFSALDRDCVFRQKDWFENPCCISSNGRLHARVREFSAHLKCERSDSQASNVTGERGWEETSCVFRCRCCGLKSRLTKIGVSANDRVRVLQYREQALFISETLGIGRSQDVLGGLLFVKRPHLERSRHPISAKRDGSPAGECNHDSYSIHPSR